MCFTGGKTEKHPCAFYTVPYPQCRRRWHLAWDRFATCSVQPLRRCKGSAGDSISAFNTLQLMEIAFQYFVEPVILRQNLCWLNWSSYLQNKYRVRPVQRRRGWIPALKGETLLCEATCGNTFSITGHRINSDVSFFLSGALSVCLSAEALLRVWFCSCDLMVQPSPVVPLGGRRNKSWAASAETALLW